MLTLNCVQDDFCDETGSSMVLYALSNLQHWRGEDAKRLKAEMKAHLGK